MALVKQNDNSNSHFLPFSGSSCCCCCLSCLLNKEKCVLLLLCVLPACVHFTWCEQGGVRENEKTIKFEKANYVYCYFVYSHSTVMECISAGDSHRNIHTHISHTNVFNFPKMCTNVIFNKKEKSIGMACIWSANKTHQNGIPHLQTAAFVNALWMWIRLAQTLFLIAGVIIWIAIKSECKF